LLSRTATSKVNVVSGTFGSPTMLVVNMTASRLGVGVGLTVGVGLGELEGDGVGLTLAVGLMLGVAEMLGDGVGVSVGVALAVAVGVTVSVGEALGLMLAEGVGASVGVGEFVAVAVGASVAVGLMLAVGEMLGLAVGESLTVGVAVGLMLGEGVGVGVTVGSSARRTGTDSVGLSMRVVTKEVPARKSVLPFFSPAGFGPGSVHSGSAPRALPRPASRGSIRAQASRWDSFIRIYSALVGAPGRRTGKRPDSIRPSRPARQPRIRTAGTMILRRSGGLGSLADGNGPRSAGGGTTESP
jgi:hypothetical protein